MLDDDHIPSQLSEESPGGFGRGLPVGAYEGLRAGQAIIAVREAGLRPSLERVEGYEDGLHGFVVSQEPSAGAEVSADTQVFLYIAAPPRAVVGGERTDEAETEEAAGEDEELDGPENASFDDAGLHGQVEGQGERQEEDTVDHKGETFHDESAYEDTRAFQADDEDWQDEADEPTPVWRGPLPGTVPRRRLSARRDSARQGLWRRLPLSVQLGLIGLAALTALALLVGLAGQLGGHPRGAQHTRAPLADRRPSLPVVPVGSATPPSAFASPPAHRARLRDPALRVRPSASAPVAVPGRAVPGAGVSGVAVPGAGASGGAVPGATGSSALARELSRSSAEEHAIREFGP